MNTSDSTEPGVYKKQIDNADTRGECEELPQEPSDSNTTTSLARGNDDNEESGSALLMEETDASQNERIGIAGHHKQDIGRLLQGT